MLGPDRRIIALHHRWPRPAERAGALGSLPTARGILGVLIDEARPRGCATSREDRRSVGFPPNHPPMRLVPRRPAWAAARLREPLPDRGARRRLHRGGRARRARCSPAWPPSRSRTPRLYEDATAQAEQARRAAEARAALTARRCRRSCPSTPAEARNATTRARGSRGSSRCASWRLASRTNSPASRRYEVAARSRRRRTSRPNQVALNRIRSGGSVFSSVPIHVDGRDAAALGGLHPPRIALAITTCIAQPVLVGDEPVAALIAGRLATTARVRQRRSRAAGGARTFAAIADRTLARAGARAGSRERSSACGRRRPTPRPRRETLLRAIETQERERRGSPRTSMTAPQAGSPRLLCPPPPRARPSPTAARTAEP